MPLVVARQVAEIALARRTDAVAEIKAFPRYLGWHRAMCRAGFKGSALLQGNRISELSQHPGQEGVAPGGALELLSQ